VSREPRKEFKSLEKKKRYTNTAFSSNTIGSQKTYHQWPAAKYDPRRLSRNGSL